MSVLKVENLRKSYRSGFWLKETEVLKGVSFTIESGGITGFLGGNGAGKTTTMKCILGLCFPTSGEISFFGDEKLSVPVKARIGFLPEQPYFYNYLTGREFLVFYGQLSTSLSKKDLLFKADEILKRVDLFHAKDRRLRGYSKGMLQKIGLAQALIHDPELVILDEPMSGLDPDGRLAMTELIRDVAKQGRAVFFSSHLLHDAQKLCTNLVILANGEVVYQGGTDGFLSRVSSGFEVTYDENDQIKVKHLENEEGVQKFLGELVSSGKSVIEVRSVRQSLEDAFIDVALRKRSEK